MNVGSVDEHLTSGHVISNAEKLVPWDEEIVRVRGRDGLLSHANASARGCRLRVIAVCAVAAVVVTGTAWGQAQHYKVDPALSEVHFSVGASDGAVKGTFRVSGGEFTLDPASGAMTGTVTVDAASGESGNTKRDKNMTKNQMKAQTYSTVTFAPAKFSGQVKDAGDSTGQVDGTFSLLGQAHPLSVPMNVHIDGDHFTATGNFDVPYVSWGMKDPSFFVLKVEKQVKVDLKLAGTIAK
jgi:polyisoprenoid-binding protein YceI